MMALFDWTEKEKWKHIKHFMDTHSYSESNVEYLRYWVRSFLVPIKQSTKFDLINETDALYNMEDDVDDKSV